MGPAIALLVLLVLPLLALATFAPRPFETAVLLLAGVAAAVTGLAVRDAFLATCAFLLVSSGAFTAGTVAESFHALALPRRRRARRRRRPVPLSSGTPELPVERSLPARGRKAA